MYRAPKKRSDDRAAGCVREALAEGFEAQGGQGIRWGLVGAIIVTGVLSRLAHTGFRLVDKYSGDALYAAMVYAAFRLTGRISHVTLWAAATMIALECFQLTGIPAGMHRSGYPAARLCARLLGTEFSVPDLLAYAAGIGCIAAFDRIKAAKRRPCGGAPSLRL